MPTAGASDFSRALLVTSGCDYEPSTFHVRVFNASSNSLEECIVRFPARIQPIGTLELLAGRIHRDIEMPLPQSVTIEWVDNDSQRQSQTIAIPPFPKGARGVQFINLVREPEGRFSVGWTNWP